MYSAGAALSRGFVVMAGQLAPLTGQRSDHWLVPEMHLMKIFTSRFPRTLYEEVKVGFGFPAGICLRARRLLLFLLAASLPLAAVEPKPRIGLVLSGGSASGLAHAGVIQWLEEHRIPVAYIGGTSMGALIGGLYASGLNSTELKEFIRQIDWTVAFRRAAPFHEIAFRRKEDRRSFPNALEFGLKNGFSLPSGLSPGHDVGLMLSRFAAPYGDMKSFDDLPTPFRCVGMDLLKGEQIVFSKGSLVAALRSTMSLPAVFAPYETEGKLMVDGATLNNLPVDVVKAMGSTLVIAVPMIDKPVVKSKITSLLSVAERSLAVMIDANARRNMALADLLIAPDLTGLENTDFAKFEEFEKRGYAAAENKKLFLMTLAVSEAEYQQYLDERQKKRHPNQITPEFVTVTGVAGPANGRMQTELQAELTGHPVNLKQLDTSLTTITGYGPYQSASYTFAHRNGEDGLAVNVQAKSYGPPFVDTGINIEGTDTNNTRFGFGGRLTFLNKGFENSEWRTDFTVGLNNSIGSEYYWRLNGGKWFLAPRTFYSQRREDLYQHRRVQNEIKVRDGGFGGDLGYAAGRFAEFRMGYVYDYINGKVTTGATLNGLSGVSFNAVRLRYAYDGQDSNVIARHGLRSLSDARWNLSTGGFSHYGVLENTSSVSKAYGPRYVLVTSLAGGTIVGPSSVFPPFSVGGPASLTAFGRGQLRGDHYYNGSVLGLRAFSSIPGSFKNKAFLLLGYEMGKAFNKIDESKPVHDGVLGAVAETPIGVVLLGYSIGTEGNRKFVFRVGKLF